MKKKITLIFVFSLILAVLVAVVFELEAFIIPMPVYAWSLLAVLAVFDVAFLVGSRKLSKSFAGYAMMLVNLILAFSVLFGANNELVIPTYLAMPFLISIQSILLSANRKVNLLGEDSLIEIFHDIFIRCFGGIASFVRHEKRDTAQQNIKKKKSTILIVISALAAVIPFVIFAIAMLSSADEAFRNLIASIKIESVADLVKIIFIFAITAFFGFSYFFSHYDYKFRVKRYESSLNGIRIPKLFTTIFLFALNVVYTIFTVVQFTQFVEWKTPDDMTLSQYTVNGFWQLIMLTLMNICIFIVLIMFTREKKSITLKLAGFLMIFNNIVMGVSAFIRLSKYEEAFGFTRIRFYGYVMLVFVAVFLLLMTLKLITEKFPLRKTAFWIITTMLICLSFVDTSRVIAKNNVDHYLSGRIENLDISYIEKLGPKAIPELRRLESNTDNDVLKGRIQKAIERMESQIDEFEKYKTIRTLQEEVLARMQDE